MKRALACFLISLLCIETVQARVARNGSSSQVAVQNRSSNLNQTANVNRNTNVNQNANINRNALLMTGSSKLRAMHISFLAISMPPLPAVMD